MDISKRLPDFLPKLLTVIPLLFLMCLEDLWIQYFSQTRVQLFQVCTWIHSHPQTHLPLHPLVGKEALHAGALGSEGRELAAGLSPLLSAPHPQPGLSVTLRHPSSLSSSSSSFFFRLAFFSFLSLSFFFFFLFGE